MNLDRISIDSFKRAVFKDGWSVKDLRSSKRSGKLSEELLENSGVYTVIRSSVLPQVFAEKGGGGNDWPLEPMLKACIARIVFRHPSVESFSRELQRNPSLMLACGFN